MSRAAVLTAEELLRLNLPNKRTELVRGRLRVSEPPAYMHGIVAANVLFAIAHHVYANKLGVVLAAETGFKLFSNPDTVRAPDVAFISQARIPNPPPRSYAAMAPDLVVEVLSPDDTQPEVREKIADWINGGSELVWVIDPRRRHARVHRANGSEAAIAEHQSLLGERVLPGFSYRLSDAFTQI
ncbi:MAG TPA: Uma2 family endonuclease [Gemmatimonadaceae bacterium]|nr:Uma2 family endonuclease [Gemmatimonadaceae bacterium]